MQKKYPRSEMQISQKTPQYYDTWDANGVTMLNKAAASYSGKVYGHYRMGFDPRDVGGSGISGRHGFTHRDYESWRPDETSSFKNVKDLIFYSDLCYLKHGIVRNVMDLMGDFASQGIRLVHPNKQIERLFQHWFAKVGGPERSERFLNNFYRLGNVVIRVQTAKINARVKERLYKTSADTDIDPEIMKVPKNEIPWQYTFLHPATIDVVGGPLASFAGQKQYAIQIPSNLRRIITAPRNEAEKSIVAQLPAEIKRAAQSAQPILLPQEKTRVYHYKKDDWQEWASPIIGSIALDISLYEKLKLCDRSALDGAISNIRIFKIGNLEHHIAPNPDAAALLASILESNTQAGTLDLIWGPDIEMIESKTQVHQFLAKEKYDPVLTAIYAGLGIPPTLTGTFGASGTTNNYISLKTLTQRLEYGRDMLTTFWNKEIAIVQEAFGFRFPATIEFDLMNLGDEVAEKKLLMDLCDRELISEELLQRLVVGSNPEMENVRIKRQQKEVKNKTKAPKAGPFHNPQADIDLKKIALQSGVVTPSEVGLELEEKKDGEKSGMDFKTEQIAVKGPVPGLVKKGQPGQGRPKNAKDKTKRKTKTFSPKVRATMEVWASNAQTIIDDLVNPIMLEQCHKKNMRALSAEEFEKLENIKFGVLCNLEPLTDVSEGRVLDSLSKPINTSILNQYLIASKTLGTEFKRKLNIQERRQLQINVYISSLIPNDTNL